MAFGGATAYMMRMQLAHPWQPIPVLGQIFLRGTGGVLAPETYTQLFTMHGGIMVFFAVTSFRKVVREGRLVYKDFLSFD